MNTHHMDVLLTVFALFSQNTCHRHTAQYLQHHVHQHGLWVWNKTSPMTVMNLTSTCAPSDVSTPSAMPTGKWSDAITRAKAVVSGMSGQVCCLKALALIRNLRTFVLSYLALVTQLPSHS